MSSVVLPSAAAAGTIGKDTMLRALLNGCSEFISFKDCSSRYLTLSASLLKALGRTSASEVIGRTDFDLYSEAQARALYDTEQQVVRTAAPVLDRFEQAFWPTGRNAWLLTSCLPLRNRDGELIGTITLSRDVTDRKQLEQELDKAHRDLIDASRIAGMAEVATGVLHNVGNVLNSLNVSASVIASGLRQSKTDSLARIVTLLRDHESDLGQFLSHDPKGRRVPEFLSSLANHSLQERDRLLAELNALEKNIDHMKEIVAMQQAYATMIGVVEALDPIALIEDAVRMNSGALVRHEVEVVRDFEAVPRIVGEQSKILQILVNLIRNAKYACDEGGNPHKRIVLRVRRGDHERVRITVLDNGIGIPPENLTRIFQHGFTTRAKGHGFGLHSAANAAREMKGTLTVHSDGRGAGAAFTLELPAATSTLDAP